MGAQKTAISSTRTVAHVGSAATVHVRGLDVVGGKSKVGQLDDNFTFLPAVGQGSPAVSDDKVLGLDISMEDVLSVASGYSITHLSKHGGNKTKAGSR